MDMPKPDLYKIIAKPESLEPSSPDMEIVGVFNSGVTTVVDGGVEKTLFMLRVAESAVEEPDDCVFLPSFDVQNRDDSPFKIELEKVPKNDLLDIAKKEVKFKDNTVRLRHISYFVKVLSSDGINLDWDTIEMGLYPCYEHERFGLEDNRIVRLNGDYLNTYVSPHPVMGVSTSFATTKDFKVFERFPRGNSPRPVFAGLKDVILFPEKVSNTHLKGKDGTPKKSFAALTRPSGFPDVSLPGIFVSYCPCFSDEINDYIMYWGNHHRILESKNGEFTGTGGPVIRLKKELSLLDEDIWFGVHHEVERHLDDPVIYRGALFGLDIDEPWKLLYRSSPFIEPNVHDLGDGYIPNVAYPTGMILRDDRTVDIYSGENDTWTSVRKYKLDDLVDFLVGR